MAHDERFLASFLWQSQSQGENEAGMVGEAGARVWGFLTCSFMDGGWE